MFDKKEIIFLYDRSKLSCAEIAQKYGVSVWRIVSFMRRNNIKRRDQAETKKFQFERLPLSFDKKTNLSKANEKLLVAGLCVYWGEGSKVGSHTVDLANSNLDMLLIFLKMLREIYQVKESKFRVYIYCFVNQDVEKLINYWSLKLNIPKDQFSKPYVRKDFDNKKVNRMPYGLVHIRYNDKRLLRQIIRDIGIISSDLLR